MFSILNRIVLELVAPQRVIRTKYNAFKELLRNDRLCHQRLAELEELYYGDHKVDLNRIRLLHRELSAGVSAMVDCLARMAPASFLSLRGCYETIDFYGRSALTPLATPAAPFFILPLDGGYTDDGQTGGKGLHLGQLKGLGLPVPDGFIVSTSAFRYFLEENGLGPRINALLSQLDVRSEQSLSSTAAALMEMVAGAEIPERLAREIRHSLADLGKRTGAEFFAVRSSAVSEDSAISFAGQYETLLAVTADGLLDAYRQVLAAKYSANALYYRINAGLLDEDTPMAVLVLEMIDASVSGVVTTGGTGDNGQGGMTIHYVEGMGDQLVGGRCAPATAMIRQGKDGFQVEQGRASGNGAGSCAHPHRAGTDGRSPLPIRDELALLLASWAQRIEHFFRAPQEIEWCLDRRGSLFLLQARSMLIQEERNEAEPPDISALPVLVAGGETASRGAACGPVHVVDHDGQLAEILQGAVLVTAVTPPSYVLALDRVRAVVAELGSAADHFASVAREAGVPVLVKTGNARMLLAPGTVVTVCADLGRVFAGCVASLLERYPPQRIELGETPFRRAFARTGQFIFPLRLVNPADESFAPDQCRSLHDLIRFVHEKGVQAMFSQAAAMFAKRPAAALLEAAIPLRIYLLDMDAGQGGLPAQEATVRPSDLRSVPLKALLRGLTHPGITWRHQEHFDWKNFSEVTMAGGIVGSSDPTFASYAVLSRDYLNLNLRFGFHFVILDSLCGAVAEENYIRLRFAGGGGEPAGISLRLAFIAEVLQRLGFAVQIAADLLEAQLVRYTQSIILRKLDQVGRLLAATTLLDMVIKDEGMVSRMVEGFMEGNYGFSRTGES